MTYQQMHEKKSPITRKMLAEQAYLTYFNDFLTVEAFAEWFECTVEQAHSVIEEGRRWNSLPKIVAIEG